MLKNAIEIFRHNKTCDRNLSAETTSVGPSTTSGVSQPRKDCKVVKIDLLGRMEVTGTLSPRFSELPDLQDLELGHTEVSGDIEALKNLRKLERLFLMKTNVFGDMAAFQNLTKLECLDLSRTRVSGSIAALQHLELKRLDLSNTNVIGDMSSLRFTSLGNNFRIRFTKITCEDAALRAVLRSLGLQAEQLTDLMNFEGVNRMLSCRNMKVFLICFLHMIWPIKLDHASPE